MRLPDPPVARALARRLGDLGFSVDGVNDYLGPMAAGALGRSALVPVQRVLDEQPGALASAIRVFLLAEDIPVDDFVQLLGSNIAECDLVTRRDGQIRALLELSPYSADGVDWFVAADWPSSKTGRPLAKNHVLGIGGASTLLAQCTVRPEVSAALDVGTGCGVQSFHLSEHSASVTATDISPRCLAIADFNFAMNGLTVTTLQGSLLQPVEDERFDLVVSNPPFVIGSPSTQRHDYRDSGLTGDEVCAQLVRAAPDRLNPDGWFQLLANWEITDGDRWVDHPQSWLAASPLDAWVVQRDVQDPAAYVEGWLHDASDDLVMGSDEVYDTWMKALTDRGVLGIGFGLITLRAGQHDDPIRRYEHVGHSLVQPVGPDVERWFAAQDLLRMHPDADVLRVKWRMSDDVEVIDEYVPGADASHGRSVRRRTGFAWSGPIDNFGVDLLACADGSASLGEVIVGVATVYEIDPVQALATAVPIVRQLVAEGFLVAPPS